MKQALSMPQLMEGGDQQVTSVNISAMNNIIKYEFQKKNNNKKKNSRDSIKL
jgi:hypothetical protein